MRRKPLASSRTRYACGLSALTTDEPDAEAFARAIATEAAAIDAGFALLFFSQSLVDASRPVRRRCRPTRRRSHYAGCSTAGEITPQGLEDGHVLAMLLPSAAFTAVSAMVDNLSSSGMDRITGEVEALRRSLRGRIGHERDQKHLRALLHRRAVLCRGSGDLGHPLGRSTTFR